MNTIIGLALKLWIIGVQLLGIWLIVALFIPSIAWFQHLDMLINILIVEPTSYIFTFFQDFAESMKNSNWDDNTPVEDFVGMLAWLGSIGLSLALPLVFWFMWVIVTLVAIGDFIPKGAKGFEFDEEAENTWHLLNGRTTVQDTYDAEVQANAIASALKKHVK